MLVNAYLACNSYGYLGAWIVFYAFVYAFAQHLSPRPLFGKFPPQNESLCNFARMLCQKSSSRLCCAAMDRGTDTTFPDASAAENFDLCR